MSYKVQILCFWTWIFLYQRRYKYIPRIYTRRRGPKVYGAHLSSFIRSDSKDGRLFVNIILDTACGLNLSEFQNINLLDHNSQNNPGTDFVNDKLRRSFRQALVE